MAQLLPEDPSLLRRTWTEPGYTIADLRQRCPASEFARIAAAIVRIAGDRAGAWDALVALIAALPQQPDPARGREASSVQPTLRVPTPSDADFTARRIAAAALARSGRLPADARALAAIVATDAPADDVATGDALMHMARLSEFGGLVLDWSESVLGLAAGRPAPWEWIVSPGGASTREELARSLLNAAEDDARAPAVRNTAVLAASCLALLARQAGDEDRKAPVWVALDRLSNARTLPPLTASVSRKVLSVSGMRARVVDRILDASRRSEPPDRALLAVLIDRALQALGCSPEGAADLDPVRRVIRRLVAAMFEAGGDELGAWLLPDLCVVAEPTVSGFPEEDPSLRYKWGLVLSAVTNSSEAPERARDCAAATLVLLGRLDVQMRGSNPTLVEVGARADVRGHTAYACLRAAVGKSSFPPEVAAYARDVLDLRISDDAECAARLETAVAGPPASVAHVSTAPQSHAELASAPPAGTTPFADAPKRRKEPGAMAWAAYELSREHGWNTRKIAEALSRAHGKRFWHGTVGKWIVAVKAFLESGGIRTAGQPPHQQKGQRRRTLRPEDLERRSPRLSERPRDEGDDDSEGP